MSEISIGLPVYNGERFIRSKIESILNQTFTNFELIISDNCSTDFTQKICEEFKKKDKRITYFRQEKNIGAIKNFEFVLEKSNSPYFMWTAVDDILLCEFIDKNLQTFENNEKNVASISKINSYQPDDELIQIDKNELGHSYFMKKMRDYVRPRGIFTMEGNFNSKARSYLKKSSCQVIYSVFKSEVIKKSVISNSFLGHDWAIFLNVLKYGNLAVIDEVLMYEYERGISGKGLISSTKQFNKGLGIIFPWLSLTNWCIRNFGLKFYVKNIDYFFQLNIEGVFSMIVNIFYNMKKRKKGN
jgi:glycosyltransferase involved in cell wall biosynthesis